MNSRGVELYFSQAPKRSKVPFTLLYYANHKQDHSLIPALIATHNIYLQRAIVLQMMERSKKNVS